MMEMEIALRKKLPREMAALTTILTWMTSSKLRLMIMATTTMRKMITAPLHSLRKKRTLLFRLYLLKLAILYLEQEIQRGMGLLGPLKIPVGIIPKWWRTKCSRERIERSRTQFSSLIQTRLS